MYIIGRIGGRRDRDRMVVGFTTTCAISSYHQLWIQTPLIARCTRYNIMWSRLLVTCGRSVVFSGSSGFLYDWNSRPRYSWNIVESGVKHHNPKPLTFNLWILHFRVYYLLKITHCLYWYISCCGYILISPI